MPGLVTIELKRLRFYAYHGLYAEERKTGNEFEIDLSVSFPSAMTVINNLEDSIDYEKLYELLRLEIKTPRNLLETFVMELAQKIHVDFPQVKKVHIRLQKLHLPVPGFEGNAAVSYSVDY
jgi:dihydroneopterin aldolase